MPLIVLVRVVRRSFQIILAEASVGGGFFQRPAKGDLRVTAPAGFGRRHIAPLIPGLLARHPGLEVTLDLHDHFASLADDNFDCAIFIGEPPDSQLVAVRLGSTRRAVVGSADYFARHGVPRQPADLEHHNCLCFQGESPMQARHWLFQVDGRTVTQPVSGNLRCSDGTTLYKWALAGLGLAWRALWEVEADLASGRLSSVLDAYAVPTVGIYAVMPHRKHMPLRVRVFLEFLQSAYNDPQYRQTARP
ncbi:MAG: substrate binding domain-containing protein [Pigmentiphaga sp.]|uniref:substrate binding domain-containing protein n=1 Tax=Pigmentiphaga sp. TaxID=1977564 RepID=UPI0029AE77B8|nr:substrate binding domain-containing protein [Pigmentiphaga sp.]MDX3906469.1 substrate binding domain-containing protein [Pigmentiphaga sp.]